MTSLSDSPLLHHTQVEPGASLEYAWDEPQATRRLRCVLEDQAVTYRDAMHQYSLDEIRVSRQHCSSCL